MGKLLERESKALSTPTLAVDEERAAECYELAAGLCIGHSRRERYEESAAICRAELALKRERDKGKKKGDLK